MIMYVNPGSLVPLLVLRRDRADMLHASLSVKRLITLCHVGNRCIYREERSERSKLSSLSGLESLPFFDVSAFLVSISLYLSLPKAELWAWESTDILDGQFLFLRGFPAEKDEGLAALTGDPLPAQFGDIRLGVTCHLQDSFHMSTSQRSRNHKIAQAEDKREPSQKTAFLYKCPRCRVVMPLTWKKVDKSGVRPTYAPREGKHNAMQINTLIAKVQGKQDFKIWSTGDSSVIKNLPGGELENLKH